MESTNNAGRARFTVIEGGLNQPVVASDKAEEENLRRALLQLQLEEVGLSVDETVEEMAAIGYSEADEDVARFLILKAAVERIGLRYFTADPELELARAGCLALSWPDRLLRAHPTLAALNPDDHLHLTM